MPAPSERDRLLDRAGRRGDGPLGHDQGDGPLGHDQGDGPLGHEHKDRRLSADQGNGPGSQGPLDPQHRDLSGDQWTRPSFDHDREGVDFARGLFVALAASAVLYALIVAAAVLLW